MSKWKDLGSGIMMWQPTADPEVDDMSIETLVAEDAQDGKIDAMESFFQELLGTSQNSIPTQRHILPATPSFSSTLLSSHTPSESSEPTLITLTPVADTSAPLESSRLGSDISISNLDFEDTSTTAYDSDRTDFVDTPDTPCPVKHVESSRRSTGATSHFFHTTKQKKTTLPVRRKLRFGTTSATARPRSPHKLGKMGLVAPEYSPSHRWTYQERDTQRNLIETTAANLNIELHRLQKEVNSPSGRAKKARCPKTRKLFRTLVRRASQEEQFMAVRAPTSEETSVPPLRNGGVTLNNNTSFQDLEYLVDAEDALEPAPLALGRIAETSNSAVQLAFRVFDEYSGTSFKDGQFVAGAFVGVAAKSGGQLPHPFDPTTEDGQKAIKITSSAHFNNSGGPSCWISVFTSFLESLTKAANLTQPRIALIDLSKIDKGNTLRAHEVIRDLKKEGLAYWANTKHYAELLVWGQIKREAIIREFSLRELILLADAHHSIADLLQLHQFQVGRRTSLVATSLVTKNTRLDAECAEAMATIAEQFGLVQLRHIENLVARLVDGWSITVSTSLDIELAGVLFARKLRSSKNSTRDVASAFVKGVEEGVARLAYWSQRRGSRVRRFRTA
ncbi:hypothetical protein JI435_001940 [Parastagonospora nodorum SN15]|uniref:DUF7587 domain-containing protein n=1 Tax=Phaeosphaeria nodorum (strain SN15 / ATCC MYA-4574 / FGSC 10173) TaxID=321614 RepID=A0A7U2EPM0_PHANO|nr:hypothetical protein HBH51_013810 [Parastagonospora nodorum]QRC90671.1 hypothetical protein JI435_001940 [Parastagonospora nodorum SN15]KAH4145774.1 hypothetical protein HBH45_002950 [Parastagonospora nodorum]KAH4585815.1 hypothetical protein HBH84_007780 [Parastagonospora nodorum]KAH4632355.1 hypothetical protein HBH81_145230 [Parastagonospora nodorum]